MSLSADKRGPLAWMAVNPVASNLLMLFLVVGGTLVGTQLKQEVFPEFDLDMVIINVPYPGASPAEVEQGVVLAIEEAVRGIDGVKEVTSTAKEGLGVITVELLLDADSQKALSDIKASVDRLSSLPEDAERPIISLATHRNEVITLVLYGDKTELELRQLVERTRDELITDRRITLVELAGVRPYEISIEIPQESLRRYDLTLERIADRVRAASIELPGGKVETDSGEILLRTTERRLRGPEFGNIVLLSRPDGTEVRLRDLGTIRDGFQENDQEAFFNGKRAAMVTVFRVGDQTPIEIADAVKEYVAQNQSRLPPGVHLAIWNDNSEIYADRVDLLRRNAVWGLLLVLLVLGLFLEVRLAFWVTLGIPISFIGTLLFLPSVDVSLNMISLFAFIVTLGMVVDDAIVVGEAVYTHRQQGMPLSKAAITGVREVAQPVIFSILTTCIAFAPLLFIPNVMGKFFRVIPAVVIIVLLISLVESLLVLPAHLSHRSPVLIRALLSPISWLLRVTRLDKVQQWLESFIEQRYAPAIRIVLRQRYLTAAACIAMLVTSIGLLQGGLVGWTFFPKIERDIVLAQLQMPFGTSVEHTQKVKRRLEKAFEEALRDVGPDGDYTRGVFAQVGVADRAGSGGPRGAPTSSGGHLAEVAVQLVPLSERPFSAAELGRAWRARVGEVPGVDSLTFDFASGPGPDKPIDFELSHPDMETLETAAARLARGVSGYAGVIDIDDGFQRGKPQLDLELKPGARGLGLTETDLARQIRSAFFGAEAVRQQRGREEVRVYVRRPASERDSLHQVERTIVRTPGGGEIPLDQAAAVRWGRSYTEIRRVDGRRVVNVTADVETGANAARVVSGVEKKELPALLRDVEGLRYTPGSSSREEAETMKSLATNFVLALIAMYILIAIAFRRYGQPLIVLAAIPFGMIGALFGHIIMGYDLSVMSMMGVVALSGVVVNDSLVLTVAVNQYRRDGMSAFEAVATGCVRRFRPILLTSLTTFFGLMPMISETSMQARFLIPMAISLGFGVLFATVITLLFVPCLYMILEDVAGLAGRIAHIFRQAFPDEPSEVGH